MADHHPTRPKLSGIALGAAAFTAVYMLGAVVAAVISGNTEFVFYIVVMVVLIAVVFIVRSRAGLSDAAIWALAVWGAAHMAGGLIPVPPGWPINGDIRVLYSLWLIPDLLKYDQIVHAYGFGVTTWVCWQALRSAIGGPCRPTLGLMILVAAAGLGFGALNEVVEFAATRMTDTNVGGYVNTGWDLVANTVGATVAAALIYCFGGGGASQSP